MGGSDPGRGKVSAKALRQGYQFVFEILNPKVNEVPSRAPPPVRSFPSMGLNFVKYRGGGLSPEVPFRRMCCD